MASWPNIQSALLRGLLGAAVVAAAGLLGFWLAPSGNRPSEPVPDSAASLTIRTVQYATELDPELGGELATPATSRRRAIDSLVRSELDRRIEIPRIAGASLERFTIEQITPHARVPVLLYRPDRTSRASADTVLLPVFVYNYALLDETREELTLGPGTLDRLDRREYVIDRSGDRPAVLWRRRDDIYLAVTPSDPDSLVGRIGAGQAEQP